MRTTTITIITITILLTALLPLIAACGTAEETLPTPIPTSTPTATSTLMPTLTPVPTATPAPPPTATPMPPPTRTPVVVGVSTTGAQGSAASSSTGSSISRDSDPAALIAASIEAMQQTQSFHAEVDAVFKVVQTEASFRMDEETFGTEFPIRYIGDFQMPDRSDGKLQIALGLALLELDIITIGETAYITNPETGAWEQFPLFLTGLPDPYDLVLAPSDTSRYTNLQYVGEKTTDGVQTHHIRADLRANVLGSAFDKLFVEVWIGTDDNLLRQLSMAGETSVDEQDTAGIASNTLGAADIGGDAEFLVTITYTDYNTDIVITPPTG